MSFVEVIARKRDSGRLGPREIADFVRGASDGTIPPEQLAALLMAITCRGMDADETAMLTEAMLCSGEQWDLGRSRTGIVDKHSTGGVGDTVSLVFVPLLVAVGVPVAMMSGRGLAHSQGTLDKLEAIPGFRCEWSREEALRLVERCGAALLAPSSTIAPADRVLYALRDVTATVPALPLIVASIMSKKLALGADSLILDVKWGQGTFRATVAEAVELAVSLRQVARDRGMAAEAIVTDMNQPLGSHLGTACEVQAALDVLGGGGETGLRDVSLRLAEEAMVLRGWSSTEARLSLEKALRDGSAYSAWERIVLAHGGDPDPRALPREVRRIEVPAPRAGVVAAVRAADLGWVAVDLGAGRRARGDLVDPGAGVQVRARVGDAVQAGEPLATLKLGRRPVDAEALTRRVQEAFEIGAEEAAPSMLILGRVDEVLRDLR